MSAPNRNALWSDLIVDELIRAGVKHVCIAPGSRSTPLTLAFYAQRQRIEVYSHLDERSAAYFALGIGLATGAPAAVLCTSGTAAANFYPAIIEAYYSRVPLLVLTADRAHEARESGANQTIDQVKLYGDHVVWAVDAALPEAAPPALALRSMRTLVSRAVAAATGPRKGPVHLNLPFRKPLEPVPVATDVTEIPPGASARPDGAPFTQFVPAERALDRTALASLAAIIQANPRGLIYCGSGTPPEASRAIVDLARAAGYPILVDGLAGLRFDPENAEAPLISAYDSYLSAALGLPEPQLLVRFGNVPTSTALLNYFMATQPAYVLHINDLWADDTHRVTHFLPTDAAQTASSLARSVQPVGESAWLQTWLAADAAAWQVIDSDLAADYFDGAALAGLVDRLPDGEAFFVGNSLPVRHLDQFARPQSKRLTVFANRGASGIDGVVSSALGAAAALKGHGRHLTLVIGDISFYHDMNGLLAIRRLGVPIRIVLLNNDGGGIFRRLPIKAFDPAFSELFLTRHGLDFSHAAALYGLPYTLTTSRAEFEVALNGPTSAAQLIEVRTDSAHDELRRQAISQNATSAVRQTLNEIILSSATKD